MSGLRAMDFLYYTSRVKTEEGLVSNQNELSPAFTNPPSGGLGFVSVLPLSDHKFDQYTDNNYHALYEGCRVPANNGKQYLAVALFKEDVNIVHPEVHCVQLVCILIPVQALKHQFRLQNLLSQVLLVLSAMQKKY